MYLSGGGLIQACAGTAEFCNAYNREGINCLRSIYICLAGMIHLSCSYPLVGDDVSQVCSLNCVAEVLLVW